MNKENELQLFGRDTERIFKEIDVIRKKQTELANEHVNLEKINGMSLPVLQASADNEDEYSRDLDYFNKKEAALKNLMDKLDDLGQIMNDFREAPDLNPHTEVDNKSEIATSSTPINKEISASSIDEINNDANSIEYTPSSGLSTPRQSTLGINKTIPIFTFDEKTN